MFISTHLVGFGAAAAPSLVAATLSYLGTASSSSGLTNYTYSSQPLGTAATGRRIIVCVHAWSNTAGRSTSSVTVDGQSATLVKAEIETGAVPSVITSIWIVQLNSGTSGDIVVNNSGGMNGCSVSFFAAYDLASSTATNSYSSTANPPSISADCSAGGIIVGSTMCYNGSSATFTWAGITERSDAVEQVQLSYSSAASAFASAQTGLTVTCTPSGAIQQPMVVAAFR